MKAKSKFAFLLSASGSILNKDALGRRLRLPQKKQALNGRNAETNGAESLELHEPTRGEVEKESAISTPKAQSKMSVLGLMVERIARESRGERKARPL